MLRYLKQIGKDTTGKSRNKLFVRYLTIIPRGCVGYEMIDSERGALQAPSWP